MKRLLVLLIGILGTSSAYSISIVRPPSVCQEYYRDYTSCNSGYFYLVDGTVLPRRSYCSKCPDSGITVVATGEPLAVSSAGGTSTMESCYIGVSKGMKYADETGEFEYDLPSAASVLCYYE